MPTISPASAPAKRAVLERFRVPAGEAALARPLVGLISRLVDQKGFDLIAEIADELRGLDASFVLLGHGRAAIRRLVARPCGTASGSHRNSHRLRRAAGAPDRGGRRSVPDAVAVRAMRLEPDVQPALRHRAAWCEPSVDWTTPCTISTRGPGEGRGSAFDDYSAQALLDTLRWALEIYRDRATWQRIQHSGMQQDFSWDASARQYVKVYERAMASPLTGM